MREAVAQGHTIYTFELDDMYCHDGDVWANTCHITLTGASSGSWYVSESYGAERLSAFDAILVRKDPPFDMEYIYATYLLEQAERSGAFVLNSPRAIRDHSEKCAILEFPELTVSTLVTRSMARIHTFINEYQDTILKPLDGMGGRSIFRVTHDDPNKNVIVETLTQHGSVSIMAQRYIPDIAEGDKRILLIAGQAVPYSLARVPMQGETRGNLAAGGKGYARPLSLEDQRIIEHLAQKLWQRGLFLVGLDVIGAYLTEINVTSPTCFQEIEVQTGYPVAAKFVEALEIAVQARAKTEHS
jgi:glutathione synthase